MIGRGPLLGIPSKKGIIAMVLFCVIGLTDEA